MPRDGDSGGPVRPLALFFALNFVGIRQEERVQHVDHEEEAFHTITIELHLQVSSVNCTILLP